MSVSALSNVNFEDSQPTLEAPILGVLIDSREDVNYADAKAFVTRWTKELEELRNLELLLKTGRQLVLNIYVYRSISDATSEVQIPPNDDSAMTQFYRAQYDVLVPEVEKLRNLTKFFRTGQQLLRGIFAMHQEAEHRLSESFMFSLVELIDIFIKLDHLKNSKEAMETDFEAYQKVVSFLQNKDNSITNNSQENHDIALFLGHDYSMINSLKTELLTVEGYIRPLTQLMTMCIDLFEKNRYVTPQEKFSLIRVIPTLLFFIDTFDNPKTSLAKTKEHNVPFIQKLAKRWPVVPLIGDLFISTTAILENSPSFKYTPEFFAAPATKVRVYDLGGDTIASARTQHNNFIAAFRESINALKELLKAQNQPLPVEFTKQLANLAIQGFKLLSDWTSSLLSHISYKFAHPFQEDLSLWKLVDDAVKDVDNVDEQKKEDTPGDGTTTNAQQSGKTRSKVPPPSVGGSALAKSMGQDSPTIAYERAVKYNYTSSERFLLVEFIGLIKGTAGVMLDSSAILVPVLRRVIHNEIQEFVQHPVRDMIRKFSKKKKQKSSERDELVELLNIVVDWKGGRAPASDPVLVGKKDEKPRQLPERSVPPSPTQLELLRNILWGFINQRGHNDVYQSKAFETKQIKTFEEIFEKSFFYKYLLDYEGTIGEVSSLSDLWYREHHLEKSGQSQFSIELSIPWLLTNHVLEYAPKIDNGMMEFLLYPLAIYNDASSRALYQYKKKFLYDEVEAEVNLAMDQLIYKLSAHVFGYFKVLASGIMFDKSFAKILESANPAKFFKFKIPPSRVHVLLEQRHFQLLGRSFDLNRIISQRINNYLRENTSYAITRFEASPITSVVAFENLLSNIRLTHFLLSQHLHHIDEWDVIFDEANESTSLVSYHGRVALHVVFEILGDVCSNFVFNSITQRFTKSNHVLTNREALMRVSMPKNNAQFLYGNKAMSVAFAAVDGLTENYFGVSHVKSIIRIIGLQTLPLLTSEILNNLQAKLKGVLLGYANEIRHGMPPKVSLPIYDYASEGAYGKFCGLLQNIINYPVILEKVFQSYREWGNALVVLRLFDSALSEESVTRLIQAAPILGVKPDPLHGISTTTNTPLEKAFTLLNNTLPQQRGTQARQLLGSFIQNAKFYSNIYQPQYHSYSLLKSALADIKKIVLQFKDEWTCSETAHVSGQVDNPQFPIELTHEFYRVWSSMLFVFCVDVPANSTLGATSHEIFGDGFVWAGTTIVHFFDQRSKFEVFDFGSHILRIAEVRHTTNEQMLTFCQRVATVKDINTGVFQVLETLNNLNEQPKVTKFRPPSMAEEESMFQADERIFREPNNADKPSVTSSTTGTTSITLTGPGVKKSSGLFHTKDSDAPPSPVSPPTPNRNSAILSSNSGFNSSTTSSNPGIKRASEIPASAFGSSKGFTFGDEIHITPAPAPPPGGGFPPALLGVAPELPPDFFLTPAPTLPPELSDLGSAPPLPPGITTPAPTLPPHTTHAAPTLPAPTLPAPTLPAPSLPAPSLPPFLPTHTYSAPTQTSSVALQFTAPAPAPTLKFTPSVAYSAPAPAPTVVATPAPIVPGLSFDKPVTSTRSRTQPPQHTTSHTHVTHPVITAPAPTLPAPTLPAKKPQSDDWDPFGENN